METALFPRTRVEDLSLSRMIIGTNWIAGWSHTSPASDAMIKQRHAEPSTIIPILETYIRSAALMKRRLRRISRSPWRHWSTDG